ncbi:hypothetical protein LP421_33795 (plasmid) [Rhizobium sp. RCAM05350]|uniref:sugar-binding transcriptional regulator n=1 Tax=Rhizobium sp. RCAM05350 TaxID=2895568 RepID=UPI002076B2B3|nr:sugar-binding domain-containing protein [Rhizobium sp. RCAM05350]URK89393.1 hypothetical protein LP421_33795 [Rhizobium sp. RCAM05350]
MVARRYYLANQQKNEIADAMGISRFKVTRLLDEARESGMVRIQIDVPADIDLELGDKVADRFKLKRVIAVRALDESADSVLPVIGAAAAHYLESVLGQDDVLGISWGRALASTVEVFGVRSGSDVVQLVGGISAGSSDIGGVELVRRLASSTGGRAFPLNAPLIVGSDRIAEALRDDPSLTTTTSLYPSLTIAVVGVGSWDPPSSAVANALPPEDRKAVLAMSPVADICGILIDAQGQLLEGSPLARRTIGISFDALRTVPEVVAVAGGTGKVAAIAAAAQTGIISTLITDDRTATQLLEFPI